MRSSEFSLFATSFSAKQGLVCTKQGWKLIPWISTIPIKRLNFCSRTINITQIQAKADLVTTTMYYYQHHGIHICHTFFFEKHNKHNTAQSWRQIQCFQPQALQSWMLPAQFHHCWESRSSHLGQVIYNPGEQTPAPLTPHKWAPCTPISLRALPWLTAVLPAIASPHPGCSGGPSASVYKAWRQEALYRTKGGLAITETPFVCRDSLTASLWKALPTFPHLLITSAPMHHLIFLSVHLCQWWDTAPRCTQEPENKTTTKVSQQAIAQNEKLASTYHEPPGRALPPRSRKLVPHLSEALR